MLKKLLVIVCLLVNSTSFAATEEPNHAIHEELRGLLQGIETAVNTEKYSDLKQYFDDKLKVTTINQNVISTPDGIDTYFKEWFGKGGYLKKLDIKLTPDALTELYGDLANPSWGLVYGSGTENYQLVDGRNLAMKTRWTATVAKEADGKWRILALHIGTNFYDNPIFAAVKDSTKYYAAGGLVLGLLLGVLGMVFLRRKKS
jgi:ketosteroid isomerase-like protein